MTFTKISHNSTSVHAANGEGYKIYIMVLNSGCEREKKILKKKGGKINSWRVNINIDKHTITLTMRKKLIYISLSLEQFH